VDKLYPSYASTIAFLQKQGVPPALQSSGNLRYICRQTKELDIYFVGNRDATQQCVTATFRTEGGQPEFWNPVDGSRRTLGDVKRFEKGGVAIPVTLEAYESGFVVFKRKATAWVVDAKGDARLASNFPALKPVQELKGAWEVTFDPKWGGPKDPVAFQNLVDWSKHSDPAIKYYSGIASYKTTFDCTAPQSAPLYLSLGTVHKLARVKLNGETLGIAWTPPYRLEVTGKVRPTGNVLEIEVANTWVNRLIGDQQPADKGARTLKWENSLLEGKSYPAGRYTFTTVSNYKDKSPLQESGLVGPVRLER